MERMWSSVSMDGDRPPCKQKIYAAALPFSMRACLKVVRSKGAHLVVNQGGEGEVVEEIGEELPDVRAAVLAEALVVKAVDGGDLPGLVVAADKCHSIRVSNFEAEEEEEGFEGVEAAVDKVACARVSVSARMR